MIKKTHLGLFILLILILLTYGNSLNNDFLSDDLAEIVNNPNIGNLGYNISSYLSGFIRPIFYWLAFQLGGLSPFLFRSINILLHIGSTFLIFTLFTKLYSRKLALIVASLFAVHPAFSEAVVWISGGNYPQYTFFFLLSFLAYLLSKKQKKYYLLSITAFLLSFMSHPQMPVSLFVIFPLWELAFGNLKKNWLKSIPFLLLAIIYLIISLSTLPSREATLQTTHYQQKGIDNPLQLIPIALTSYFELILYPSSLTLYHSELSFSQINFAIRFFVTLAFFVAIFISFKKNKFIFFWLSFFIIALSPTLTPFRLNWIVAERYLYLPSLGLLAVIGYGIHKLISSKFKQITYIVLIAIIISLSIRTIIRSIDWKNEDNLWIATGKTSPSSPNNHNNLGDVYGRRGDKQAALKEFQTAIALKPNYGDAYHNLANTYRELGQNDKALENYQNALKYNPNLWQSYQNIAAIYFEQGKYDLVLENFQKAIQVSPDNLNLRLNLGIVYLKMGEKNKAKEIFNLILSVDPNNQIAKQGLIEASK